MEEVKQVNEKVVSNPSSKLQLIRFSSKDNAKFSVTRNLFKHFFSKLLEITEEGGDYISSYYYERDEEKVYDFFISLAVNIKKYKKEKENENVTEVNFPEVFRNEFEKSLGYIINSFYNKEICPSCIKNLSNYIFSDKKCIIFTSCEELKKKNFLLVQPFSNSENIILCFYKKEPTIEELSKINPIVLDEDSYEVIVNLLLGEEEEEYEDDEYFEEYDEEIEEEDDEELGEDEEIEYDDDEEEEEIEEEYDNDNDEEDYKNLETEETVDEEKKKN